MKQPAKESDAPLHLLYAKQMAKTVSRTDDDDSEAYSNVTKQVSVPLPFSTLATVEVLARRAGVSRGAMVAQMAKLGCDLVLDQLEGESLEAVALEVNERQLELYEEFDPLSGD